MKTLADQVAPLVAEAKRLGGHAPSCSRPEVPEIARVTVEGWSLCLDMHEHDGVGHFGFSAKLFPPGRGSTMRDWRVLGQLLAEVTRATGLSSDLPMPDPIVPIEEAHPNATIHWVWHDDGSPVEANYMVALRMLLDALTPKDPASPTADRNEPCPCGSGRKFKKCCGGN